MKISKIHLKNFKSFKTSTINFCDLMAFIGENNAGKSNVLKALDLFFSDTKKLDEYFFNDRSEKITIQIWFRDLGLEAKKNFAKYILEDGETVIIRKEYFFEGEDTQKLSAVILEEKFGDAKDRKDSEEIVDANEISLLNLGSKKCFWKSKPFGWATVASGYLPDFLYVPAVKDIKEEAKITSTSRFGQIINTMLSSVLQNEELKKVNEQYSKLLMGENENQDGRIVQLKEFEISLTEKLSSHMKGTSIRLDVSPPTLKDIFQAGTKIMVNDGISTAIENKGHGMQRSVIFVIFRVYADLLKKEQGEKAKALIFGIEEPELYLHPQMQRAMFALLKEISKTDQVIFTTHSSFFVDMTDYKSIAITTKDATRGTNITQHQGELFTQEEEKKKFRLLTDFDPERNELFFGKKVVLVEGDTEKVVLPIIASKIKPEYIFYDYGITIVECGSKEALPLYIKILNAFQIPYLVIYDKDTGGQQNTDIENDVALSNGIGKTEVLEPDFEEVCKSSGITFLSGKRNKPFKAFKVFKEIEPANIPQRIRDIVENIFSS